VFDSVVRVCSITYTCFGMHCPHARVSMPVHVPASSLCPLLPFYSSSPCLSDPARSTKTSPKYVLLMSCSLSPALTSRPLRQHLLVFTLIILFRMLTILSMQIFHDVMLEFSENQLQLAAVIPVMDGIDEDLSNATIVCI